MTRLLERVRALVPELATKRESHDAERKLHPAVVASLRQAGVFGALVPSELGGEQLAPAEYIEVLETLAAGDSATAWCVMTASTSTLLAAYLPRQTAASIWSPGAPAPMLAGIFAPSGTLKVDDAGARLTGRWSWASGSNHATWFALGALHDRRHVVCIVPRDAVQIVDNWDTLGLAGTGSHDVVVDVAVGLESTTSVFDRAPWTEAPLYKVPLFGLLATGIASCALGIAQASLDHIGAALTVDTPPATWARFADLRGELDAARAYLVATATAAYAAATTPAPVAPAVRGALRLAASHVTARCAEVTRGAFHLGGGAAVRATSPLGASLRDIETVLTHRMVTERVRAAAARAMLGVGTPPADL